MARAEPSSPGNRLRSALVILIAGALLLFAEQAGESRVGAARDRVFSEPDATTGSIDDEAAYFECRGAIGVVGTVRGESVRAG